jgi:hypothetical protein
MLECSVTVPFILEEFSEEYRLVSGTFDILHKGRDLYDLKTVNVWKKVFDPDMVDWHQQQNIYAYLLGERGVKVETLNIIAIYKDWIKVQSLRDRSYPPHQICQYRLKMWKRNEQERFIWNRLQAHVACEKLADDELPECTPEERWERFPGGETVQYAVMKNDKARRALRVTPTLDEAITYANGSRSVTTQSFIEVRHAQRKRCETYCPVAQFCDSYQRYVEKLQQGTLNDKIMIGDIR